MPLPDSFLQELRVRSPIEEVVSSYVRLKRTGRNFVGLCPLHNEKTPSFTVYPDNDSFFCFGCSAGGDMITFIKLAENLDYMEAVRLLAQRAGLTVPEGEQEDRGLAHTRRRVLEANLAAARFYHETLWSEGGASALSYLRERRLSDGTIKRFGLGFAPDAWDTLCKALTAQGFTHAELIAANLVSQSRTGGYIDIFRNRVMFPIIDLRGNVIAFGGRVLSSGVPRKYVNTSDTVVYKKSRNVFALNLAKNEGGEELILAEGYMDVISLYQAGFRTAIASLGTALTAEQAQLIAKYAKRAAVCYDADEAGRRATHKAIPLLKRAGLEVRVLTIPEGKDPDDYIKSHGAARFKNLLTASPNDVEFRLSELRAAHNNCVADTDRIAYMREAVALLATLPGAVERDIYAARLAQEMSVEKSSVMEQLKRALNHKARREGREELRGLSRRTAGEVRDPVTPDRPLHLRAASAEEALIAYILRNPDKLRHLYPHIKAEDFVTEFNRRVYGRLTDRLSEGREISLVSLSAEFSNEEMSRVARMTARHAESANSLEEAMTYREIIREEKEKLALAQRNGGEGQALDTEALSDYLDRLRTRKK